MAQPDGSIKGNNWCQVLELGLYLVPLSSDFSKQGTKNVLEIGIHESPVKLHRYVYHKITDYPKMSIANMILVGLNTVRIQPLFQVSAVAVLYS